MSEALHDVTFTFEPGLELELELDLDLDLDETDTLLQPEDGACSSDLPKRVTSVRSITNSPGCTPEVQATSVPRRQMNMRPIRRARAVRVDAWAAPASVNWTRTRNPMRKVNRVSCSTDWALPF